jgi:acetyltransferase
MLELRPSCECCDVDLPPDSALARICSFECTFCATCAERRLQGRCPNCGGELLPRPRRPAAKLAANPPSTVRVHKPQGCGSAAFVASARARDNARGDVVVRRVAGDDTALLAPLGDLLVDAVHSGASIGFLAPLAPATARRYWDEVYASLDDGRLLWVAESAGRVVGTVQIGLCDKDNGRHRAEVQKLLVHTGARGRGIATLLMQAVEAEARRQGRSLLFLDTLRASAAEEVYRHLGWQRAGEIPDYAAAPDGKIFPTVLYYKQLDA